MYQGKKSKQRCIIPLRIFEDVYVTNYDIVTQLLKFSKIGHQLLEVKSRDAIMRNCKGNASNHDFPKKIDVFSVHFSMLRFFFLTRSKLLIY